jgi:hypothetical protein
MVVSLWFHCGFIAFSLWFHCAFIVVSLRFQCVCIVLFIVFLCGGGVRNPKHKAARLSGFMFGVPNPAATEKNNEKHNANTLKPQ